MFTEGIGAGVFSSIFAALAVLPAWFMLRLVWPLEVEDRSMRRAKFKVRRSRWTHRERQSQRLGRTLPILLRAGVSQNTAYYRRS